MSFSTTYPYTYFCWAWWHSYCSLLSRNLRIYENGGTVMTSTVVGVFDDFTAAINATPDLVGAGFRKEDISVVAQDQKGEYARFLDAEANPDASSNVGTGALVGGVGGLLIGLAALAIPGIGPIVAAGPLAAALGGAAIGVATGSFVGALNGMGVPEFEAK